MSGVLTRERMVAVAASLGAVLAAFLVGGIFLEIRGKDAVNAYRILFERGLFNPNGLTETFKTMAPLLIISAGLLIALKAGVWNIGLDGQFFVGALLSAATAAELVNDVPRTVMLAVSALAGFAGGLIWAVVPAALAVRFGLNEIITTLMMNYVALNVTSWGVKGPFKDPSRVAPETAQIPRELRLPFIPGTDVHIGLIAGVVVVIMVAILFRSTVPGYMLTVLGRNRRAALHAGMPVGGLVFFALLLSGGFAGLAGANDVLGVHGVFKANWDPGYGFTAFALVYLARLNSLAILPFAFFFAFLHVGGATMPRRADVPTYFIGILEGLMLIFFACSVYVERRLAARDSRSRPAEASSVTNRTPTPNPVPATGETR